MSYSPTVAKILNKRVPARPIDRVRRIWPDIVALREAGLLYQQIWEELPEHYNLTCPYKTFMSACRQIQRFGHKRTNVVPVLNKGAIPVLREDPFERARRKMEEDERGNNILAGKLVRP